MIKIENINKFIEDKNIKKIYIDVDGVLWSTPQAIADLINEQYGTNGKGQDILSWNFKELLPYASNDEIEKLFTNDRFFDLVQPIDGALEFINRYCDKIIIVTKGVPHNYVRKREWFDNRGFQNIPIINIPLNVSKGIINMGENALFIDDSYTNLLEVDAEWCVQFREYNDNKNREWEKEWNGLTMFHW